MNLSASNIIAGLLFGAFGVYFIKRAKSEASFQFLGVGMALCIYPYFVENPYLTWAIGAGLMWYGFKFCE